MPFNITTTPKAHKNNQTPSSPIFNFITPTSSRSHNVSYYTPLTQADQDFSHSPADYAGSQLTYTPISNHHPPRILPLEMPLDAASVAQRADSRLRWLAGLAGSMILMMLLGGNRLGSASQLVLGPKDRLITPSSPIINITQAHDSLEISTCFPLQPFPFPPFFFLHATFR